MPLFPYIIATQKSINYISMRAISDNITSEQLLYEDFQSGDRPPANYQSPLEMIFG